MKVVTLRNLIIIFHQFEQMELEIREISNPDEKQRQLNHLGSFKAELKRLEQEYNLTKRRVKRYQDRRKLLSADDEDDAHLFEVEVRNSAKDR